MKYVKEVLENCTSLVQIVSLPQIKPKYVNTIDIPNQINEDVKDHI